MNKFILSIAVATTLISCSDAENIFFVNKTNTESGELKLIAKQVNKLSLQSKEIYKEGDSIGIYFFTTNPTNSPSELFFGKNVQAKAALTRQGRAKWTTASPILLPKSTVALYAYLPYCPEDRLHPEAIPMRIAARAERTPVYQFGILSKGQKSLNRLNPVALISMRPVLADLSFRLTISKEAKEDYSLEAIQVGNQPGGTLCRQKAFLNLSTGEINGVPSAAGATRLTVGKESLSSVSSKEFRLRVLPTPRPAKRGEIEVLFIINRKTYPFLLPPDTDWKSGYNYLYELVFDGEKLTLVHTTCQYI